MDIATKIPPTEARTLRRVPFSCNLSTLEDMSCPMIKAKVANKRYLYGPGLAAAMRKIRTKVVITSAIVTSGELDRGYSDETAVSTRAAVK